MPIRNWVIAAVAAIIFATAVGGTYFAYRKQVIEPQLPPSPNPTPTQSFEQLSSPSPNVLGSQPTTGGGDVKNIGIFVENPGAASIVTSPLVVNGQANVYEGAVVIKIKDTDGQILSESTATACMGLDACAFQVKLEFANPKTPTGTVEVYNPSPRDGSPQYLQVITVRFQ